MPEIDIREPDATVGCLQREGMRKADISYIEGLKRFYAPDTKERRVLLLVSSDGDGRPNAMPFTSWAISTVEPDRWCLSVYVIAGHYTRQLIDLTGQFTVNVPREGMQHIIDHCGSVSGRDHDKFRECGLTGMASRHVKPPIIGEGCVNFECETRRKRPFLLTFPGQERKPIEMSIFEGEVVAACADETVVQRISESG